MNIPELQLLVGIMVVLGSGVTSWVGVRVALAELRGDQKRLDDRLDNHRADIDNLSKRVERLENKYFN